MQAEPAADKVTLSRYCVKAANDREAGDNHRRENYPDVVQSQINVTFVCRENRCD